MSFNLNGPLLPSPCVDALWALTPYFRECGEEQVAPRVRKTGKSKVGAVCSLGLIDLWVSGGQVEYRKDPNLAAQGRQLRFQSSVPPVVAMQLLHCLFCYTETDRKQDTVK